MASSTKKRSKLARSKEDRIIAGVCGGIAEHFNVDPLWVRLAAVLLVFVDGIGIILYLAAWLLLPDGEGKPVKKSGRASYVLGILFVGLGLFFLLDNVFDITFRYFWPALIIILGVYFLTKRE